jgi:hypothetical protein
MNNSNLRDIDFGKQLKVEVKQIINVILYSKIKSYIIGASKTGNLT